MSTVVGSTYTTPDLRYQDNFIPDGGMFCLQVVFSETVSSGNTYLLAELPPFAFRALGGYVQVTAGDTSGAFTIGYGTYDGTTYTNVDADYFHGSVTATGAAAAVALLRTAGGTAMRITPPSSGTSKNVLAIAVTGGSSIVVGGTIQLFLAAA